MIKIHEYIRQEREKSGFTLHEMANRIGITMEEMWDIENDENEIFDAVDIRLIKKIALALNKSPLEIVGIESVDRDVLQSQNRRHEIIREKRIHQHMTQEELGDVIGFMEKAIQEIENDSQAIEYLLPYSAVIALSQCLDIPLQYLIGI